EIDLERLSCRVTTPWVAAQGHKEDSFELGMQIGASVRRRRHVAVENLLGDSDLVIAIERSRTREELVEDQTEAEHVAATIDRVAATLLGRHVDEFAADGAGTRDRYLGFCLRDPEVDELDRTLEGNEDVGR